MKFKSFHTLIASALIYRLDLVTSEGFVLSRLLLIQSVLVIKGNTMTKIFYCWHKLFLQLWIKSSHCLFGQSCKIYIQGSKLLSRQNYEDTDPGFIIPRGVKTTGDNISYSMIYMKTAKYMGYIYQQSFNWTK